MGRYSLWTFYTYLYTKETKIKAERNANVYTKYAYAKSYAKSYFVSSRSTSSWRTWRSYGSTCRVRTRKARGQTSWWQKRLERKCKFEHDGYNSQHWCYSERQ